MVAQVTDPVAENQPCRPTSHRTMGAAVARIRRERMRQIWLLGPALLMLILFFLAPTLDVVRSSILDPHWTLTHYERFFTRPVYLEVLLRTVRVSILIAVVCTVIGYPVAHFISQQPRRLQFLLMFLIFVPLWMSILIRSYAWIVMLGREGIVNSMLIASGVVDAPLKMLYTSGAVYVAMVQILLPIQIVTCYGAMTQIDGSLVRAARILGARPWQAFVRVFLPLSLDGTATGALLVFILSMGFFITPALLGGQGDMILGNLIEQQVAQLNWGFASTLGVVLLIATLGSIALVRSARRVALHLRRSRT